MNRYLKNISVSDSATEFVYNQTAKKEITRLNSEGGCR